MHSEILPVSFTAEDYPRALLAVAAYNSANPGAQLCADVEEGSILLRSSIPGSKYRDRALAACAALSADAAVEPATDLAAEEVDEQARAQVMESLRAWFAAQGVTELPTSSETGRIEFAIDGVPVDFGASRAGHLQVVALAQVEGEPGELAHVCNFATGSVEDAAAFPVKGESGWWCAVHTAVVVDGVDAAEFDAVLRGAVAAVLKLQRTVVVLAGES
ncbi:hypothetical protein CCICO_05050 [Corynebacterium ciconiae DSM 44920]|uniref:hypothetical protein n=1 Tax=Corynebacterium ciconiae TaxID=227319 RepID=UPI00036BBEDB|nr:hypothetical protein [Corynebacterium ciconiae]WKD61046.1 hypothetical protein CCICO_05050 [Corynebacterium ciconiae DSM 44920]